MTSSLVHTTLRAFGFAGALTGGLVLATVAYAWSSHKRLATLVGFEGVGVFTFTTSPTGADFMLAHVGERKNDTTGAMEVKLSVPGGKVEVVDVFSAIVRDPLLFIANSPLAVALETAVREYKEETGVKLDAKTIDPVLVTGHGKTTTGKPVYVFARAIPWLDSGDWKSMMLVRKLAVSDKDTDEFTDVEQIKWPLDPADLARFRKFNRKPLEIMLKDAEFQAKLEELRDKCRRRMAERKAE